MGHEREGVDLAFEVARLKDELEAAQKENNHLNRRLRRRNRGDDLIVQAAYQCFQSDPPRVEIPKRPVKQGRGDREIAVLHITDTQAGKVTDSYSLSVLDQRLGMLADKTLQITEKRRAGAKIEELVLELGGDMVEGELIFAGQPHEIEQSVFDQAVKTTPEMFSRLILRFLEHFKTVRVRAVVGNHGRPAPFGSGSHRRTNWDRVFYEVLRGILDRSELKKRLDFQISDSFYDVTYVYDWGLLLVHGDQIRGGFAGIPFYGIAKKSWGWIDSIPEPWDFLLFGHFHQIAGAIINHREWLCGGTTESGNVYAQEQLASAGHPCQRLYFFDETHGLIAEQRLFLTDPGIRVPQRKRIR